jgi:hypothetical protein
LARQQDKFLAHRFNLSKLSPTYAGIGAFANLQNLGARSKNLMYNRILNRPMFKRGGKTIDAQGTGITSGLDTPRSNYLGGGRTMVVCTGKWE